MDSSSWDYPRRSSFKQDLLNLFPILPIKRSHPEELLDDESNSLSKEKLCWEKAQAAMKRALLRSLELQGGQSPKSRDVYYATRKLWTDFCRENGCSDGNIVTEGKAVWFLEELTTKPPMPYHYRPIGTERTVKRPKINDEESDIGAVDALSKHDTAGRLDPTKEFDPTFNSLVLRGPDTSNRELHEPPGDKTGWAPTSFEAVHGHFLALIEMWKEQVRTSTRGAYSTDPCN
jgi:hypothetical protein